MGLGESNSRVSGCGPFEAGDIKSIVEEKRSCWGGRGAAACDVTKVVRREDVRSDGKSGEDDKIAPAIIPIRFLRNRRHIS